MIPAPLSVLHEYALIDETDDALARPVPGPDPLPLDGEDPAAFEARKAAHEAAAQAAEEDFARRFVVACETGDWRGLIVEGKQPTWFRVKPPGMTAWDAFRRIVRPLGEFEIMTLAFRLGVVAIDNLNLGIKIERGPYLNDEGRRERALGDVLTEATVDAIARAQDGRGAAVVHRIGAVILGQRGAPLGK